MTAMSQLSSKNPEHERSGLNPTAQILDHMYNQSYGNQPNYQKAQTIGGHMVPSNHPSTTYPTSGYPSTGYAAPHNPPTPATPSPGGINPNGMNPSGMNPGGMNPGGNPGGNLGAKISTLTKFDENRIDSMAIPRPCCHYQNEQLSRVGGRRIPSDYGGPVNSSLCVCTYIEDNESTPRFIKQSLTLVPHNRYLLTSGKIPLSLIIYPFPQIGRREYQVPKIDLSPYSSIFKSGNNRRALAPPSWDLSKTQISLRPGPLRCDKCGAYSCAFFQFAVRAASCHLCGNTFNIPDWYANLLEEHRRQIPSEKNFKESLNNIENIQQANTILEQPNIRSELLRGTVDFLTHSHYLHSGGGAARMSGKIQIPYYSLGAGFNEQDEGGALPPLAVPLIVYVIDCSFNASSITMPATILNSISYLVQSWPAGAILDLCCIFVSDQICLSAYDESLEKISGLQIIADVSDPFLPSCDASKFLIRVETGKENLRLNNYLNSMIAIISSGALDLQTKESAIGSAISVAVKLIAQRNKLDLTNPSKKNLASTTTAPERGAGGGGGGGGGPLSDDDAHHRSREEFSAAKVGGNGGFDYTGGDPNSVPTSPRIFGCGGLIQVITSTRPTLGIAGMKETPMVLKHNEELAQKSKKIAWPTKSDWTCFQPHPKQIADSQRIVEEAILESASITVYAQDIGMTEDDASKLALGFYLGIVRQTGGQLYHYPNYTHNCDYEKLYMDMQTEIGAGGIALDVSFKLRISKGLKITQIKCPWTCLDSETGGYGPDVSSFTIPRLHHHTSICFDMDFTEEELPGKCTYVQGALSYTDIFGRRCLRVINKRYMLTSTLNCVFRMSDMEAALTSMMRGILFSLMSNDKSGVKIREETDKALTQLLLAYRLHAAMTSPYGQLILPEAFKMLPIYITALFKTSCFRTTGLMADTRVANLYQLMNSPLNVTLKTLYPHLYPLHRSLLPVKGEELGRVGLSTDVVDELTSEQYYYLPATVATSGERVHSDSVYALDDGHQILIYVGSDVDNQILQILKPKDYSTSHKIMLPQFNGQSNDPAFLLRRIWCAIAQIRREAESPIYQPARLICAGSMAESEFIWKMAEDRLSAEKGYVDYLVDLHRAVQKELADV